MITEQEYQAALKVVNEYKTQLKNEFNKKLLAISEDLKKYFKNNLICGVTMKEFKLEEDNWFGSLSNRMIIIPINPYFDENYWDEKADADIEQIGLKYGIKLGFESDFYPK